jgi:NAD(P)H-flavin reductase
MEFFAGQYISIRVTERGERRSYSIASTPDVTHGITLVAEMVENGKGSARLGEAIVGEELTILGPLGNFVVRGEKEKLLFVATGSGIVPIWSMINDLLINKNETRPMRLHWGMRSEKNMFWFDNLERLSEEHSNFVFDQVLSRPSEQWELCTGHVQDCLRRDFSENKLIEWEGYVCGNPKMVEETRAALTELGMPEKVIFHEKFS